MSATRTDTNGENVSVFCLPGPRKVDVLFVVDDGSSMADEAEHIAANSEVFGAILDAPSMDLDLRVAVTPSTARNGGLGELVSSSCLERADDFRSPARDGTVAAEVFADGCAQTCGLEELELLPVAIDDAQAKVRPWLQQNRGTEENFAAEGMAAMLGCMLPVGVAGRGPSSPIGAMLSAIARSIDARDPAFDWMRDDATLLTVLLTDGDEQADPTLPLRAALFLEDLQRQKRELDPASFVALSIVAGWDPHDQAPHPSGCSSYRQFAEAPEQLDALRRAAPELVIQTPSICGEDFTPAIDPLALPLRNQIRPWCIPHCVAIDENGPGGSAPSCYAQLREWSADDTGSTVEALPSCMRSDQEWRLPDGVDRCIAFALDEEINIFCDERGMNVEAQLLVREGAPLLADACLEVTCEQAEDPSIACPNLR